MRLEKIVKEGDPAPEGFENKAWAHTSNEGLCRDPYLNPELVQRVEKDLRGYYVWWNSSVSDIGMAVPCEAGDHGKAAPTHAAKPDMPVEAAGAGGKPNRSDSVDSIEPKNQD